MTTTGAKIKKASRKNITVKDETLGELPFVIRGMSTYEFSKNSELFDKLPKEGIDPDKLSNEKRAEFATKTLFPLIEGILPLCVISPRVTLDPQDKELLEPESDVIHLSDLPINTAALLFNQILETSGLGKKTEDLKKKSEAQTSAKQ